MANDAGVLTVRVPRQHMAGGGIQDRPTKGCRGDRPVELTDGPSLPRGGTPKPKNAGAPRASGLVALGTPLNGRNVVRWYKALLEAAHLPPVRFHHLRHTAATLLLRADARVLIAQRRPGHRDPGATTRLYGHVLPGDQRAAAESPPSRRRSRLRKSLSLLALTGAPGGTRTPDPRIEGRRRPFPAAPVRLRMPV